MAVLLNTRSSVKQLVAIGNNSLWYESMSGIMTKLAASDGDIDTSDNLNVASAFQKVFIVNGVNLKVADFVNTKLTVTALTTAPARGSTVIQATSNAAMKVDYVNSAKTLIYGYTTSGTFVTTAGYTLSGGGMDPETRVPTSVDEASTTPHWYDWTVYIGDTDTYGIMPAKAYLICVYRGRLVISGNPENPNQWDMSRASNPFDFLYGADDAMSAVAGNNADAAQCADIVRALIPFHDDYLIFGCATTLWLLRGDPVSGGSLDNLSDTTGIFGANSWCFDENGNLYLFGTGGIYKIARDFSGLQNISDKVLPELIHDEDANPTTHRITMRFDRKRNGLIICITTIATGANSNYFFSLKTGGFYPETYPYECGAYSLFYYASNDPSYSDLLFGCKDGYIRKFLDTAKNDDIGETDQAISSYVTLPILPLNDLGYEGKLTALTFHSAGGASAGGFTDSDGFSWELHKGNDAETVLEDIIDGATASVTGTITGTGRNGTNRLRLRGAYAGLKLYNSTASETWGLNQVLFDLQAGGKL